MINIQRESFRTAFPENGWGARMTMQHYHEAGFLGGPFDLNKDIYERGDRAGKLILVVARNEHRPVGYCTAWVTQHSQNKNVIVAQGDTLYVDPECRGQWVGYKLIKKMIEEVRPLSARVLRFGSKMDRDIGPILKRLRFELDEVFYTLRL